jgi:periplasmic divalent cation tolerance protein
MTDKIVILCTCGSEESAEEIGRALVNARLAACVNLLPHLRSIYRWKDAVETAEEWLLIVKTSRALFPEVRQAIERLHKYEVPEVIALPVTDGAPNYLEWLEGGLKEPLDQ